MEEKELQNVSANVLSKLQQDIEEIKLALLGNAYNPQAGLVYRMAELERENAKLKSRIDRIYYVATGVTVALTVAFNLIMAYFDKFVLR